MFHSQYISVRSVSMTRVCQRYLSGKIFNSTAEALHDLKDGATILFGGFGLCGIPENLISAIRAKGTKDITVVSNDAGTPDFGLGILFNNDQVCRLYASYVGENKNIVRLFTAGKLELNLTPQGTLAEKLRAGGAGIPAFYTPTGVGTVVQEGKFPIRCDSEGKVAKYSEPKEVRVFDNQKFVLERSLRGDFACIKAWKADTAGNLIFHGTARNFNPEMAKAAKLTVAEVEEIVEAGTFNPDDIHVPGVYVQRVVKGEKFEKRISKLTLAADPNNPTATVKKEEKHGEEQLAVRNKIAARAAKEFHEGMYINLGIGKDISSLLFVDCALMIMYCMQVFQP
jgi:3-oxoacid CoA-transferase